MTSPTLDYKKQRDDLHKKFAEMGLSDYWQLGREEQG